MGMVPSYKTNEWQVAENQQRHFDGHTTSVIQIRVKEGEEWRDYWVPADPANTDYAQYQQWLAEGNEPKLIF